MVETETGARAVLLVRDLTAEQQSKTHKLRSMNDNKTIKPFTFPNDITPMEIPTEYAQGLVDSPCFEVTDLEGNVLKKVVQRDATGREITLPPGHFIVPLRGIMKEYLVEMVKATPGGEKHQNGTKPELISFLMSVVDGAVYDSMATGRGVVDDNGFIVPEGSPSDPAVSGVETVANTSTRFNSGMGSAPGMNEQASI